MGGKRKKEKSRLAEYGKNSFLLFILMMTASVVIGYGIGFIIGNEVDISIESSSLPGELGKINISIITVFISIFMAVFIQINIHEFGHYVFGRLAGYRLLSYRFSIFSWDYENGKMVFSIRFNKGYSGLCAMIPPEKGTSKIQDILYNAGGIIFNLVFSIIFLAVFFYVEGFLSALSFTMAVLGVIIGITNLIPFREANIYTDGKFIFSMLFNRPLAATLREFNILLSQMTAGILPADLNVSLAAAKEHLDDNEISFLIYAYWKALDEDDEDTYLEAARLMEENIDLFPSYSIPGIYYELCFIACISGDEEKAREYYEKVGKTLEKDRDINGLRVKAYYEYYINRNPEKALVYARNGLVVKDKYPLKGLALLEEKLIRKLLAELEEEESTVEEDKSDNKKETI